MASQVCDRGRQTFIRVAGADHAVERRRHADNDRVAFADPAEIDGRFKEFLLAETGHGSRFDVENHVLAGVETLDLGGHVVDAYHPIARVGELDRQRHADIPKPDDADQRLTRREQIL